MHLHDRHGAHLILDEAVKQAGQRAGKHSNSQRVEVFSYSVWWVTIPREKSLDSVKFSLQGVTTVFHSESDGVATGAFASKPAPTRFRGDHMICEHPGNLWERACSRRCPNIHHITKARPKKTPTRRLAFLIKRLPLTQACDDQSPDAGRSRLERRGVCPMVRPCRPGRCLGVSSALAWPGAWCRTDGPPLAYREPNHHEVDHDLPGRRDRCDHRLVHRGLHRVRCDRWPDAACVDRARRLHGVRLACGPDARLRSAAHGSPAA
jgi:hypothetical protein